MPTPNERRALIFLAALGAPGVGVRAFRSAPGNPQGARGAEESRAALGRQIDAVDSATLAKRSASGRGRSQRAGTPAVRSQLPKAGATESRAGRAALDRRAQDVPPPDPLALYERRRLDVARRNRDVQARIERDRADTGSAAVSPPPAPSRGPSRFTRTLGTLLSSGVSILDGLEITAKTAGNRVIQDAIMASRSSIAGGDTIAAPLAESRVFPPMVISMIAVGEQTGGLDEMLTKIADFYDDEVDAAVGGLLALLEPLVVICLGVVVGGVVVAIYLQIFDMINAVQ